MDTGTLLEAPLFTDTVAFRVAPWIMTPNTQPPLELYVCSVVDAHGSNKKFLDDMAHLASKASCKLVICPRVDNRNDRWIQVGRGRLQEGPPSPWAPGPGGYGL
ncbi:protein-arginine deiminase type-1-like, partial [Marmota marmota marmota]|uniref:protein-arginine deiminase type-1-like n=1 Tax=Marmota marmota marmota TaxID=9994 RepID=UPI002093C40E